MASYENTNYCCICLTHNWITQLSYNDANNFPIISKLQNIVPEVEWNAESKICLQCLDLVNNFNEFKKLCLETNFNKRIKLEEGPALVETILDVKEAEASAKKGETTEKSSISSELCGKNEVPSTQVDKSDNNSDVDALASDNLTNSDSESSEEVVKPKRRRKKHKCDCGSAFFKKSDLKKHTETCSEVVNEKSATEKFSCGFNCQLTFTDINKCKEHQKICLGLFNPKPKNRPYADSLDNICDKCTRKFTSEQVLSAHVKECNAITDLSEVRSTCVLCNSEFCNQNALKAHFIKKHHVNIDDINICLVCNAQFDSALDFTAHVHTSEEVAGETHLCDQCSKEFENVLELGKHCFTAHDTVWVSDASCEVCLEIFKTEEDAIRHYKTTHNIKGQLLIRPYLCWHCPGRFNLTSFKTHVRYNLKSKATSKETVAKNTSVDVKFKCDLCGQLFISRNQLNLHCLKDHNPEHKQSVLAYFCRHCAIKSKSIQALCVHTKRRHLKSGNAPEDADKPRITCEICNAPFTTPLNVIDHCKLQHNLENVNSTITPYACPHCPFRCVTLATFKEHIATYFKKEIKQRYVCPTCGADFSTKQILNRHEDAVHKKITHMCEACGKIFPKRAYLSVHIRKYHPDLLPLDKQFRCTHCDRWFTSNCELQMHIDRVNGVKNYACDVCPRRFTRPTELNKHMERVHSEDQTRKHECPECHQFFKDKGYMKLHMKKAHNLGSLKWIPRSQRPREHACHLCSKDFVQKRDLERHLDSHAGIKRYACQFCNAPYAKRENLKAHLRKHHNFTL